MKTFPMAAITARPTMAMPTRKNQASATVMLSSTFSHLLSGTGNKKAPALRLALYDRVPPSPTLGGAGAGGWRHAPIACQVL